LLLHWPPGWLQRLLFPAGLSMVIAMLLPSGWVAGLWTLPWLAKRYERTGEWVNEWIVSRYHWYAIVSKFMYFTTRPTIFLAGWHGFEFKKFLKITTYSTIVWATIIMSIGLGFGFTVNQLGFKKITHSLELFAIGLFAVIFLIEWGINRLVRKKTRTLRELKTPAK
jgi:membrane protein DedA with SNARE-associated domain